MARTEQLEGATDGGRGQQAEVDATNREESEEEEEDDARDDGGEAEGDVHEHKRVVVECVQPAVAQPLVPLGADVEDTAVADDLEEDGRGGGDDDEDHRRHHDGE